jgi:hypothetical protein
MVTKNQYEEMATRSVNRAAAKVFEEAKLKNHPLPIWKDGKVEYLMPSQKQIDELIKRSQQPVR